MPNRMFEPAACDYLKKIDSGWEFSSQTNLNQFQKNFNGFNDALYQNKNPSEVEISPQFDQYIGQFTSIKNEHTENDIERDGLFRRGLNSHAAEYHGGITEMVVGDSNKYYYNGMLDMECTNGRGFVDLVAFGSCLNKPPTENNMSNKPMMNTMNLPVRRKPSIHNSYQVSYLYLLKSSIRHKLGYAFHIISIFFKFIKPYVLKLLH